MCYLYCNSCIYFKITSGEKISNLSEKNQYSSEKIIPHSTGFQGGIVSLLNIVSGILPV